MSRFDDARAAFNAFLEAASESKAGTVGDDVTAVGTAPNGATLTQTYRKVNEETVAVWSETSEDPDRESSWEEVSYEELAGSVESILMQIDVAEMLENLGVQP